MRLSDFDYELPGDRIAQAPCAPRDAARLLVHDVAGDGTTHRRVRDLPELLRPGDLVVVNDTRVLPTRLYGRRRSGGRVELLLLDPADGGAGVGWSESWVWTALVNPARKLRAGEVLEVEGGALRARMLERPTLPDGRPGKTWLLELLPGDEAERGPGGLRRLLERHGHTPLPPYIRRPPTGERSDREDYQTVYAERPGAVAAPTAGLHFTPDLLARLEARGVGRATVTLHVGHGTFEPVSAEHVTEHRMHAERFELGPRAAAAVNRTRAEGGRVVAVGTTSARVLESCCTGRASEGRVEPRSGETDLFLHPGARFDAVDVLLTNFHLPRSSLLLLVSAFAGRERILRLYREAIEAGYRFYSYGDAMLLVAGTRISDSG